MRVRSRVPVDASAVSVRAALCLFLAAVPIRALAEIDPNAAVVQLRTDCTALDDCFETSADLEDYIGDIRKPDESAPLLVSIGPGRFGRLSLSGSPSFPCDHITFRGVGPENTVIGDIEDDLIGLAIAKCERLTFESLSVRGAYAAVQWLNNGTSRWNHVELKSQRFGWYDAVCDDIYEGANVIGTERQEHYFFSSRIVSLGTQPALMSAQGDHATAYRALCKNGHNWFFGSEIALIYPDDPAATPVTSASGPPLFRAVEIADGSVQLFGSLVRLVVKDMPPATPGTFRGVDVRDDENEPVDPAIFHMHGGIVSVITAGLNSADPVSLLVNDRARAHVLETAFTLIPAQSGTPARLQVIGTGTATAPFHWGRGADVPVPGLVTLDGADTFEEIDCSSTGDCDDGGSETHTMVYNALLCDAGSPWFNSKTGRCRNDYDGDGISDQIDNCPFAANPSQLDTGGVGGSSAPDSIGDACQCGDFNGNGYVTGTDGTLLSKDLDLTLPGSVAINRDLCNVDEYPACTERDVAIIKDAELGLGPGIVQACKAALP